MQNVNTQAEARIRILEDRVARLEQLLATLADKVAATSQALSQYTPSYTSGGAAVNGLKLCKTRSGGIPARSASAPGTATVDVANWTDLTLTGDTLTASNYAGSAVGATKFIMIGADNTILPTVFEDCG